MLDSAEPKNKECPYYDNESKIFFDYYIKEKGYLDGRYNDKCNYLFFILKGSLSVRYNEYGTHIFEVGSFGFVPKASYCDVEVIQDAEYILLKYDIFKIKCTHKPEYETVSYATTLKYEFKSLDIRKPLEIFLNSIVEYIKSDIKCNYLLNTKMDELYLIFQLYYTKKELDNFFNQTSISSISFRDKILNNYLNVKTVEELATMLGYGETAFLNMFKKNFGISPYRWIQQQKSKKIYIDLVDNKLALKEIADKYKFTSPAHLNTYCKKYLNSTPGNIRLRTPENNEKATGSTSNDK